MTFSDHEENFVTLQYRHCSEQILKQFSQLPKSPKMFEFEADLNPVLEQKKTTYKGDLHNQNSSKQYAGLQLKWSGI